MTAHTHTHSSNCNSKKSPKNGKAISAARSKEKGCHVAKGLARALSASLLGSKDAHFRSAVSVRKARMVHRQENLQYREDFEQGMTMLVIIPVDHNLCLLRKIHSDVPFNI